jgi:hypothetical protein
MVVFKTKPDACPDTRKQRLDRSSRDQFLTRVFRHKIEPSRHYTHKNKFYGTQSDFLNERIRTCMYLKLRNQSNNKVKYPKIYMRSNKI